MTQEPRRTWLGKVIRPLWKGRSTQRQRLTFHQIIIAEDLQRAYRRAQEKGPDSIGKQVRVVTQFGDWWIDCEIGDTEVEWLAVINELHDWLAIKRAVTLTMTTQVDGKLACFAVCVHIDVLGLHATDAPAFDPDTIDWRTLAAPNRSPLRFALPDCGVVIDEKRAAEVERTFGPCGTWPAIKVQPDPAARVAQLG